MSTWIEVLKEVRSSDNSDCWVLCFQYCKYHYNDGNNDECGYRFIWRKPDGSLHPARGQARIPNMADLMSLVSKAMAEGWGNINDGDKFEAALKSEPSNAQIEKQSFDEE